MLTSLLQGWGRGGEGMGGREGEWGKRGQRNKEEGLERRRARDTENKESYCNYYAVGESKYLTEMESFHCVQCTNEGLLH